MTEPNHSFAGQWITTPEMAALPVYNVFHRQLDKSSPKNQHDKIQNRHILFRRKFTCESTQNAILRISADDYYKLYINGQFVQQGPTTAYTFRYFYNKIDVTKYLHEGENTIAIHTYYQGLINRVWVSGDNRHGLILDLTVNGKTILKSDESFLFAEHTAFQPCGIAGYLTQFLEKYDANAPEVKFHEPDFDDSTWKRAVLNPNNDYNLIEQPSKQLVFEDISPIKIKQNGKSFFIDFGAIYVGYLTFKAKGRQGDTITIQCGQELLDDGSVRFKLRANCNYEEFMVLSGKEDTLNQFDYKTFRYAQIILPNNAMLDLKSIRLIARHYPFNLVAKCNKNDAKSIAIWNLCTDSLKYGVQEVIMDCMEREKGYYMGDACYSLLTYCILNNDFSLMRKFFDDFLDSDFINPGLMTCTQCSFMQEIAEYPLILITLLAEFLYLTDDTEFVRKRFNKFTAILDFYKQEYAEEDGLLNNLDKWCVVEWPAPARDGYDADIAEGKVCTVKHNAINAYYIGAIKCINKVAKRLELKPYADTKKLTKAFIDAFYDHDRKLFRDSVRSTHISLPANVYAAYYGLLPDEQTTRNVVEMIREKRLMCMLFVPFPMLCFLVRIGETKLVDELLHDPDAWLNILAEGGTRTFEGWGKDRKWNTSLFHLTVTYGAAFLTDWDIKGATNFEVE